MSSTILLQLRDAAKQVRDEGNRTMVRRVADDIEQAVLELYAKPTGDNLIHLNGLWALAVRILKAAAAPDPSPTGGAEHEIELTAVSARAA